MDCFPISSSLLLLGCATFDRSRASMVLAMVRCWSFWTARAVRGSFFWPFTTGCSWSLRFLSPGETHWFLSSQNPTPLDFAPSRSPRCCVKSLRGSSIDSLSTWRNVISGLRATSLTSHGGLILACSSLSMAASLERAWSGVHRSFSMPEWMLSVFWTGFSTRHCGWCLDVCVQPGSRSCFLRSDVLRV